MVTFYDSNPIDFLHMERITLFIRTRKQEGHIRLRFRLTDTGSLHLYHKSEIVANLSDLAKFKLDGTLKPRVSLFNKELFASITYEIDLIREAYRKMQEKHLEPNSQNLELMIKRERNFQIEDHIEECPTFLKAFDEYIEGKYRDGLIGESRYRHGKVISRQLNRFFIIYRIKDMPVQDFTPDLLMQYRTFIFDEYKYVEKYSNLYEKARDMPTDQRSNNTVVTALNHLQAFFNELEDKEQISKSPFRRLGKERKSHVMTEKYDKPIALTKEEFMKVKNFAVPEELRETWECFLLQCTLGCRIGDYQKLSMENVGVTEEGIPYIHYLAGKTVKSQKDYEETETPLVKFALDIIKKYQFNFHILHYVSGKDGYNKKIKRLLKFCGIDRSCPKYNEGMRKNEYFPVYELMSNMHCRKICEDMINKIQVDAYATGLRKTGSKTIERYICDTMPHKYKLWNLAFDQPACYVDKNLNPIEKQKVPNKRKC